VTEEKDFETTEAESAGAEVLTALMLPQEVGTLGTIVRSEIDMQIATAKAYPRSITAFRSEVRTMATLNEKVAASCTYALPRREKNQETGLYEKKSIKGPSVRFAEIIASAWGNCRAGSRIISEDDRFVTAQGFFFDVQRNVTKMREVRRRITTKSGNKFSDDMVAVTANAACSIAVRNATFDGIPEAFWADIHEEVQQTAVGDVKNLAEKRDAMIEHFKKLKVTPEQIFATLDVKGIEDIGLDELAEMKGYATSIKEGDATAASIFAKPEDEKPKAGKKGVAAAKESAKGKES
jgi:hypothetical protein